MLKKIKKISLVAAVVLGSFQMAHASGGGAHIEKYDWPQNGVFGKFDRAAMQRGLQVYREVCAACHSLDMIAFRNLTDLGYNEDEVKAIARDYDVEAAPDDEGEVSTRPATPSDYFPSPFENEQAARASNNGALPPDFSLIIKSREHVSLFAPWTSVYGEDYLVALMMSYEEEAPHGVVMQDGMNYNAVFEGNQIAMAPPLSEGLVEYADGTEASVEQMSKDIAVFLYWVSDPSMEQRKQMGLKVIAFMILMSILLYYTNKQVWRNVKKGQDIKS